MFRLLYEEEKVYTNSAAWSSELNNDEFLVGDLVWVKRENFSFWPSIVSIDPDSKKHIKKLSEYKNLIHVHFLNANGKTKWTNNLEYYYGNDTILYKYPKYLSFMKKRGKKMKTRNVAIKEANSLLKLDREERWIKFANVNKIKSPPTTSSVSYSFSSNDSSY